jgi:hypothetical protein
MRARSEQLRSALALLALAGPLLASVPQVPPENWFQAADGSRFLLIPVEGPPVVHWAMATPTGPVEDPPGLDGLALAVARASLHGTWSLGSVDPAKERAALEAVDAAARVGGSALAEAEAAAATLADRNAFSRVLVAAPALGVALSDRGACAVLTLATTVDAIGRVAALLVERRERAALRGLLEEWRTTVEGLRRRYDQDPMAPLRAEAMALVYPGHPLGRAGARPTSDALPDRAVAMQVWQRTQRPERTVHVLVGGFRAAAVRAELERAFSVVPVQPPPPPSIAPRPPAAARRSEVPGADRAALAAFRLPGGEDADTVAVAQHWLGSGPDAFFATELGRRGIAAQARCSVVHPGAGAAGVLLVELQAPAATGDLGVLVLELCAAAAARAPTAIDLSAAHERARARFYERAGSPPGLAAALAEAALLRPGLAPSAPARTPPAPETVHGLLQSVLGSSDHVVVQWRAW